MLSLEKTREKVDELDFQILKALAARFDLMQEVAAYKRANHLPVEDKEREKQLLQKRVEQLKNLNYDDSLFVEQLFTLIMKKAKELQDKRHNEN